MLHLNIVTPEMSVLSEDVLLVTVPGKMGEMQILAGHTPILAALKPGVLSYEDHNHKKVSLTLSAGVVEVDCDQVNVLCEQVSLAQ